MKKINFLLILLFLVFVNYSAFSTTHTVTAGGIVFTPADITVTVGDTVKWQWLDGTHTTTSGSIPTGAGSWNAPLDASHQTYFYAITQAGTYNYYCIPHQSLGMTGVITAIPSAVEPIGSSVPGAYNLGQNFPNPFNPTTNIRFDLPKNSQVRLIVYDLLGQQQAVLVNGELSAGSYNVDWNASAYPSGIYFYSLSTDDYKAVRKMILAK
jgi:plastocyanin